MIKKVKQEDSCLISTTEMKSLWLKKLFNHKTKKAVLCANLSALIFLGSTGFVFAIDISNTREITGETFENSTGSTNGGVFNITTTGHLTLDNVKFIGNTTNGYGGAIYNSGEMRTLTYVSFTGNTASGYGGAIFNDRGTIGDLNKVSFTGNTAGSSGGAIFNVSGTIGKITNFEFIKNEAKNNGGVINNNGPNTLTIGAGLFSGNMAGGKANSIYNTGTINFEVGTNEILNMLDPMAGGGTITKTGVGTWKLGGSSEFIDSTQFTLGTGSLYLYRAGETANANSINSGAMVENANIIMTGTGTRFTSASGTEIMLGVGDEAHKISAETIFLQAGSKVGVNYDTAFITSINNTENNRHDVLVLNASTSLTNESEVLAASRTGTIAIGASDYQSEVRWNNTENSGVLSLYLKESTFNEERGGSNIVSAPESIALNNQTNDVITNRQKQIFADKKQSRYFWGTPFFNKMNMDNQGTVPGYDISTPGFAMGYDDYIGESQFLGIAVTAAWPDYSSRGAEADGTDVRVIAYGGTELSHNWELGYMIGYGWASLDQNRSYNGYKYTADYGFNTLDIGLSMSKRFQRTEESYLRPYISYDHLKIDTEAYQETGEGSYALGKESKTSNIDRVRIGFDYIKESKENENKYWRAGLFWMGQYGDTESQAGAYFLSDPVNSKFTSYGSTEDRNSLGLTLGWGTPMGKSSEFHINYTGLFGDNSDTHDFNMTFAKRF